MVSDSHSNGKAPHGDTATSDTPEADGVDVGAEVELVTFESQHGYGRVAIERTPNGESDKLKLQAADSDAENGHRDIETLADVGRWFSNDLSWTELHDDSELAAELPRE